MKVAITLYPYGEKQPAGLAETILSLSRAFAKVAIDYEVVLFVRGEGNVVPDFLDGVHVTMREVPSARFWLDAALARGKDIDVWIYNTPVYPVFRKPKKGVVIALDYGFMYFSKGLKAQLTKYALYFINYFALWRADGVVTISEYTKQETTKLFPRVSSSKITTIMAGYRNICATVPPEPFERELPSKFFLSIGVIKPRKNQLNIVRAFLLAKARGLESELVVCGKGGGEYMAAIEREIALSSYGKFVHLVGHATYPQVSFAYRRARALVFPSKLEGFGFPVLEAMSCDLPVVTANTNSVVEVAGDAAITVDPDDVEAIAKAMLQVEDDSVRRDLIAKGKLRCEAFSWEKTARSLLAVVKTVTQ